MSKKLNWAEVDKRIRARKTNWSAEELKAVEASLAKLPDRSGEHDFVEIPQPALQSADADDDGSN
jgi:hypothetical protein